MRIDLKESMNFPFNDPGWGMKLLLATVSQFLVVTAPATTGYALAVIRETANGEDEKLPEFGSQFVSLWVKGFILSLALGLIMCIPMGIMVAMGVGVFAALGESAGGAVAVMAVLAFLAFLLFCLAFGALVPALMLRYAMTDSPGSLLDISSAINDIKQGPSDYLKIALFPIGAGVLITILSGLTAGLGTLLAPPLFALVAIVQARMLGMYYRAYFH